MLEVPTSTTRKLGDVWLPEGVKWAQEFQNIPLSLNSEYTTGGMGVIWQQRLTGLQPITLNFDDAWLNKNMVDALRALSLVPISTYVLLWDGKNILVSFTPDGFKIDFLEGYRKVINIEDCPFVGTIELITRQ